MTEQRKRVGLSAVIACLAIACGSSEPASTSGGATVVRCTTGSAMPCTCQDGRPGMSACQLDGTFGVCNCNAAPAPFTPGAGGTASVPPVAGTSAVPSGGAPSAMAGSGGSALPIGGGGAMEPVFEPVMVDPADVASCMGGGAPPPAEEMVEVLEIRTSDVVPGGYTPPGGTWYGCFWIELDMPEKHHIVGWEGAIGGDRTIHHQQVSLSNKPAFLTQQGGLCGLPTVEYTWTGGSTPEWAPSLAGYPIGGPENGGKARFLWQTHFEGSNTAYSGGFNVYITKKLRKYDAGNFEQGDVRGIMIPPMASATHVAKCTPEMTMQKLVHPIYVFASMLHAHLTIRNIKAEHYRDGQLLHTLGAEMSAGFGFFDQRFKPQSPCIEILPGDEIVTTCDYQNPFDFTVMGGEATNQEMCTIFMQYFPRLPGTSNNFCGTIDSSGGFNL